MATLPEPDKVAADHLADFLVFAPVCAVLQRLDQEAYDAAAKAASPSTGSTELMPVAAKQVAAILPAVLEATAAGRGPKLFLTLDEAAGLSPDHTRWIPSPAKFFLPVDVLAPVFRGKFTEALKELSAQGKLRFPGSLKPLRRPKVFAQLIRQTFRQKWVVYCKRPFGGADHALRYLGGYTH